MRIQDPDAVFGILFIRCSKPCWSGCENAVRWQLQANIFRETDMASLMSDDGLDLIFRHARTHSVWLDKPVPDSLLRQVYDLGKMGPTSANMSPLRIVFVKSREAKERLRPALHAGNVDKTMAAPVTAIFGMELHFYEQLPRLFPHADAKVWFKDLPENVLEYMAL